MNVNKTAHDDSVVIDVDGRIDTTTAPQLEDVVDESINQGAKKIVFGFKNVEYISSAGLRVILGAQKRVNEYCGTVTVKEPNAEIIEIFEMTGFIDIIQVEK